VLTLEQNIGRKKKPISCTTHTPHSERQVLLQYPVTWMNFFCHVTQCDNPVTYLSD